MSKMSRDKGVRFERAVAHAFQLAGFDCDRVPNSGGLRLKGDLYGDMPLHVEAKHEERWDVPGYIRQAETDADGKPWAVVMTKNRMGVYAVLPFRGLLGLLMMESAAHDG